MSYDLAISDHGDLILGGNRDLAGVSGEDLNDQRITIRLTVHRGSWFYDTEGTLGSDLYQAIGKSPDADLAVDARVRDALREMGDITVENIDSKYDEDGKSLVILVEYAVNPEENQSSLNMLGPTFSTSVVIPVNVGGGAI